MINNKWLARLIASVLFLMTGITNANSVLISGLIESSDEYSNSMSLHLTNVSGYPANVLFHQDLLQDASPESPAASDFLILLPHSESTTIAVKEAGFEYCRFTVSADKPNHVVLGEVVTPIPAPRTLGCSITGDFNDDTFIIRLTRAH